MLYKDTTLTYYKFLKFISTYYFGTLSKCISVALALALQVSVSLMLLLMFIED